MPGPDVDSAEGLLIDGANRVGMRPTSPARTGSVPFVLGALVAAAAFSRARPPVARLCALVAIAVAAAPGLRMLLFVRADAPGRLGETAAEIDRLGRSIESFARVHGCASVVRSDCVACRPVARLALAGLDRCASPAPIALRAGALEGRCVEVGGRLDCGPDPRPGVSPVLPSPLVSHAPRVRQPSAHPVSPDARRL